FVGGEGSRSSATLQLKLDGRAWLLQNESVSFQRRHAAATVAEIFVEDGRGISEMVAELIFLCGMCSLDAGATNAASGRSYAEARTRHFQTTDRDQYDGFGGQRDRGRRSDGAALSRCRISRERHPGAGPKLQRPQEECRGAA